MAEGLRNVNDNGEIDLWKIIPTLKKYLPRWIMSAVILGFLSLGYAEISTQINKPELKSLVGFTYDGIDKGLDPAGRKFDINTLKSPEVIEMALTETNTDLKKLESVRNGISFEKIIPASAYDKFTVYNSILEKGGSDSLDAGEKVLETSYYPTQFTVCFDYNNTGLSGKEAVNLFNTILEKYDDYFYKKYGYNELMGNALSAISYEDYDYPEAVDVFSNSLSILKNYVGQLASEDKTLFRSTETGYTFNDLYSTINTLNSIDLDSISSYIERNNVTKNKEKAITYTEYRIESLKRYQTECEEKIQKYGDSINKYSKDQVLVFGGTENINTKANVASEQYDKMFSQENSVAADLAQTKKEISYYESRLERLRSGRTNSTVDIAQVESDLASLNEKLNNLIDVVSKTSDEYYRTVTFANAYNILVPASLSSVNVIGIVIENARMPFVVTEVLAFLIYLAFAFGKTYFPKVEDDEEDEKKDTKDNEAEAK